MSCKLKEIRMKEYMMSAREFAKFLNVEYTTYNQWENEVTVPRLPKAAEVAKKLNKKIEDIWCF